MKGFKSTRTKAQDLTEIKQSQSGFLSGMNLDAPKSDVGDTQVTLLDNCLPFRDRIEARGGLRPNTDHIFGASTTDNTNACALSPLSTSRHYDEEWDVVISNEPDETLKIAMSGAKALTYCDSLTVTQTDPSYVRANNKIVMSDNTQSLLIEDRGSDYFLRPIVNDTDVPATLFPQLNADPGGPFALELYIFKYTFARIIDGVVVSESKAFEATPYSAGSDPLDGTITPFSIAPDSDENRPSTFYTSGQGEDNLYTHIRYYRTIQWDFNATYKSLSAAANSLHFYFVGEYLLDDLGVGADGVELDLNITDAEIEAPDGLPFDPLNHPIYWQDGYSEIPASRTFATSGAMLLSKKSDSELVYCPVDTGDSQKYFGWYNNLFQFSKGVNGSATTIRDAGSAFVITTTNKTYYIDSINVAEDAGQQDVAIFTPIMNSAVKVSDSIGINMNQALAFIPGKEGGLIALNSDGAIRQYNGYQWSSTDLARHKVHSITKGLIIDNDLPCSAVFSSDAYLLFYNINSGVLGLTQNVMFTLRMGTTEEAGYGFSNFTGEPDVVGDVENALGWPYLSVANTGNLVHAVTIKGVLNIVRKQYPSGGSTLTDSPNMLMQYTGDKFDNKANKDAIDMYDPTSGVNTIDSTSYFNTIDEIEFPEVTPATESDFIYFLKSNFYLRADKYSKKYTTESGTAYNNTTLESVSLSDIVFSMDVRAGESEDIIASNIGFDPVSAVTLQREVQDHRIRISMRASNGGFQLTGYEAKFKRHIRTEILDTTTGNNTESLSTGMYSWINQKLKNLTVGKSRASTLDIGAPIDGSYIGSSPLPQIAGTVATIGTGPDGNQTAISLTPGDTYEFEAPSVSTITNATVMFWGSSISGTILRTGYSPEEADGYRFYTDGSKLLKIDVTDNEVTTTINTSYDTTGSTWEHYAFVHNGSNWKLYVDGVLSYTSGVDTLLSSIKDPSIILGGTGTVTVSDIRMYNKAITAAELLFYNSNVINNEGDYVNGY